MRKVLSFSGFLMLGLVVSQFLPMMAGDGYGAVKSISNVTAPYPIPADDGRRWVWSC